MNPAISRDCKSTSLFARARARNLVLDSNSIDRGSEEGITGLSEFDLISQIHRKGAGREGMIIAIIPRVAIALPRRDLPEGGGAGGGRERQLKAALQSKLSVETPRTELYIRSIGGVAASRVIYRSPYRR